MTKHFHAPALQRKPSDVVKEYDEKVAAIEELCREYRDFHDRIDMATTVGGSYSGRAYSYHPSLSEHHCKALLLESAWKTIYNGLMINDLAGAADRKSFELALKNPPEFTVENIAATFGDYIQNPRFHMLKALAEAFCSLDSSFRSHSKVKIGVKGLPKRVILSRVTTEYGASSYGAELLRDCVNAVLGMLNEERLTNKELANWIDDAKKGRVDRRGFGLRVFGNCNGHLFFEPHRLATVNEALAEFYGDVLPDSPEAGREAQTTGTAVAKDLQFYPTPQPVIDTMLSGVCWQDGAEVLEPSCGDGRMMESLLRVNPRMKVTGIEVNAGRAQICRDKGLRVMCASFFQVAPKPMFDYIVMNPPFYGLHWKKHVAHARKFLKERGIILCVLPASAFEDGHLAEFGVRQGYGWRNLPTASFRESGTNIATGYATISAA